MRLVDNDEVGLEHGIGQDILGPHIRREQNIAIFECRSRVGNRQFANLVFFAKRSFELLQQHQPVAKHEDLLILVKSLDDLAREHGLTGAGWRFQDKSAVLLNDRGKTVDDFLLPVSQLHWVLISGRDGRAICIQAASFALALMMRLGLSRPHLPAYFR